ncbi:hypothetical protein AWB71_05272 [Caballeronia peredens]|nr:hypothetical protein AWB71_05272 [Caballeronia peredens]
MHDADKTTLVLKDETVRPESRWNIRFSKYDLVALWINIVFGLLNIFFPPHYHLIPIAASVASFFHNFQTFVCIGLIFYMFKLSRLARKPTPHGLTRRRHRDIRLCAIKYNLNLALSLMYTTWAIDSVATFILGLI